MVGVTQNIITTLWLLFWDFARDLGLVWWQHEVVLVWCYLFWVVVDFRGTKSGLACVYYSQIVTLNVILGFAQVFLLKRRIIQLIALTGFVEFEPRLHSGPLPTIACLGSLPRRWYAQRLRKPLRMHLQYRF